jgi:hypothetical protein
MAGTRPAMTSFIVGKQFLRSVIAGLVPAISIMKPSV